MTPPADPGADPQAEPLASSAIDKLVAHTDSLYSLPTVALDVLKLTESASVDVAALKQTIERDPALVVKLLKVVNSSLFGLSSRVSNLTQALALLGVQPLKMLVLGFSLPDRLLAEASGEQLSHFWRVSLTRALVARDLASERFEASADDAFIAGLLQDIGVLALLGRLGESYAMLLAGAAEEGADPAELERASLGFERTQLSAALARQWRLPAAIADAIDRSGREQSAAVNPRSLARPLHLADLLVRLVINNQLDALPELIRAGEAYCGLTKDQLRAMVEPLEQRVAALAEAMASPLDDATESDYLQVLTDAHARLALVTENALAQRSDASLDDELCESLLAESHELRLAMRQFLGGSPRQAEKLLRAEGAHRPTEPQDADAGIDAPQRARLGDAIRRLAQQTRAERQPLTLALLAVDGDLEDRVTDRGLKTALAAAAARLGERRAVRLTLGPGLVALVLPAVGRGDALAYVEEVVQRLLEPPADEPPCPTLAGHAGVASVEIAPKRLAADNLIEAAERCLAAARQPGGRRVRSIEVY